MLTDRKRSCPRFNRADYLNEVADEFSMVSSRHSTTGLDAGAEVNGNTVKMTRPIEDFAFDEK